MSLISNEKLTFLHRPLFMAQNLGEQGSFPSASFFPGMLATQSTHTYQPGILGLGLGFFSWDRG